MVLLGGGGQGAHTCKGAHSWARPGWGFLWFHLMCHARLTDAGGCMHPKHVQCTSSCIIGASCALRKGACVWRPCSETKPQPHNQ